MTEEGSAVSEVLLPSRGGCLQISKLSWSSSVAPAIPTISPFLLVFTLPQLADVRWYPARQFPLFKDSSVLSCLHRWQIHSSKMSAGREIFKEGRARGQELLLLFLFLFPEPY